MMKLFPNLLKKNLVLIIGKVFNKLLINYYLLGFKSSASLNFCNYYQITYSFLEDLNLQLAEPCLQQIMINNKISLYDIFSCF